MMPTTCSRTIDYPICALLCVLVQPLKLLCKSDSVLLFLILLLVLLASLALSRDGLDSHKQLDYPN